MKKIEIGDKSYPKNLLNIFEPPKVLYVMGDETILDNFGIAIVGSRNASEYGKSITKSLAYSLAKHNVNIISGMAKGIDEEAHKGALMANGKTIAVLGGGFFHIYPKENEGLFHEILRKGGAVITEYEDDVKPLPQNFPRRNRIISGLSQGVVVTEARERSGSLITVDFALNQGKDVFAVPGNIFSKNAKGTNGLIKEGAKLVENVFDILEEFKI